MKRGFPVAAAGLAAMTIFFAAEPAAASDVCDRACLEGMVNRYIDALVAHDPGPLPLAVDARFTENGQELRLGDGLWGTASGPGKYKLYVADPEDGQVGFLGTVFENGNPVYMALRLKVEYGLIREVETILARPTAGSPFPPAGKTLEEKGQPRPQFLRTVPRAELIQRDDLVSIANSYFTGLAGNTGRNTAPFAKTCQRWENGAQTTNNPSFGGTSSNNGGPNIVAMNCEDQQKSGFFPFVTSIRDRRFPVVDRERGLVLSFAFFEHDARMRTIKLTTGQTVPNPVSAPLTFEIAELFQIDKGKIDQVEAVLNTVPYGMTSDVWDEKR